MYLEIGETTVINGNVIKCVEDDFDKLPCYECYFTLNVDNCRKVKCCSWQRKDKKSSHYVVVEEL